MNPYKIDDVFYRYDETNFVGGDVRIYLSKYYVVKLTPKGVKINSDKIDSKFIFHEHTKFIGNDWIKKYAHNNKEDALKSFVKRKERQLTILRSQINNVKRALNLVNTHTIEDLDGAVSTELSRLKYFNIGD